MLLFHFNYPTCEFKTGRDDMSEIIEECMASDHANRFVQKDNKIHSKHQQEDKL